MTARVGTSGWQYADWRGGLYPVGIPQRLWLERYAETFDTVEVNNAFYRLPELSVFESWRERTPPGFLVVVKASRYLTHIKGLRQPAEPVARLLDRAAGLGSKLGQILLQLPPTLQADAALLAGCLDCFPAGVRVAVEPRHASWWTPPVRRLLTSYNAALCWADRRGRSRRCGAPPIGGPLSNGADLVPGGGAAADRLGPSCSSATRACTSIEVTMPSIPTRPAMHSAATVRGAQRSAERHVLGKYCVSAFSSRACHAVKYRSATSSAASLMCSPIRAA